MKPILPLLRSARAVFGIGALVLLGGCSVLKPQVDSTRFYVLRLAETPAVPTSNQSFGGLLQVGPGRIAPYLDNTSILQSDGPLRIHPLPYDQWAEPLGRAIDRILIEQLRIRAKSRLAVAAADPNAAEADARLSYEILRLDGSPSGDVVLEALWSLQFHDKRVHPRRSRIVVPVSGVSDTEAYVGRLAEAVSKWADEVAAAVDSPDR